MWDDLYDGLLRVMSLVCGTVDIDTAINPIDIQLMMIVVPNIE